MSKALERARTDLEENRLWKARDRLQGAVRAKPYDQEILRLLGEICFRMGDLPSAGSYWYLTERTGQDADESIRALHGRFGPGVEGLLKALPFHPKHLRDDLFIKSFPPGVQHRLNQLRDEAAGLRPRWGERHFDGFGFRRRDNVLVEKTWFDRRIAPLLAGLVIFLLIGIWILGLAAVFYLILHRL
jgi:hypothetical protein